MGGELGVDLWAVKANDDVALDVYDGDAALARLGYRFFSKRWVFLDVFFGVGDAVIVQVSHGHVAEGAPAGAVHGDVVFAHIQSIA